MYIILSEEIIVLTMFQFVLFLEKNDCIYITKFPCVCHTLPFLPLSYKWCSL